MCVRLRACACALLGDSVPSVCIVSLLDCSASSKLALRDCFNAQHTPTLGAYLQELLRVRANAATHQRNRATAPGECRCARGGGRKELRCVVGCSKENFPRSRQTQETHRRKEKFFTQRDQIVKSFVDLCEGASALFHWSLVRLCDSFVEV